MARALTSRGRAWASPDIHRAFLAVEAEFAFLRDGFNTARGGDTVQILESYARRKNSACPAWLFGGVRLVAAR